MGQKSESTGVVRALAPAAPDKRPHLSNRVIESQRETPVGTSKPIEHNYLRLKRSLVKRAKAIL